MSTTGNTDNTANGGNIGNGRMHLNIYDDLSGVARAAADLLVRLQHDDRPQEHFALALSGGSTPRTLHGVLVAPPYREQIDWESMQYFWGDERSVPPDDPESNYRMARETLLLKAPVTADQVHRVPTERGDPALVAELYEADIRRLMNVLPSQLPRFDLILLGMGPDGHCASLFPHTEALAVRDRLVTANHVPQLHTDRITFTVPVINNAAAVVFLVAGADKADALAAVLEGPPDPETYPSQLIAPEHGTLHWLVDRAAAAKLRQSQ
ncbi:MAG TPA: 6-phosphogluconolactonase [Ktedonobacterales bacterium]|nr:6-phosphogluconolactonase [Ktedonobacterales bacterium]